MVPPARRQHADLPPVDWDYLRERVSDVVRSEVWKSAIGWAIDCLELRLGRTWLGTRFDRAEGLPPMLAGVTAGLPNCAADLIEFALRLELTSTATGFPAIRRQLTRDHRDRAFAHSLLQLEVAGLAMRDGCLVELEPSVVGSAKQADVGLSRFGEADALVEAFVVFPDDEVLRQQRASEILHGRVRRICLLHGVAVQGHFSVEPDNRQSREFFDQLECAARLVADDRGERVVSLHAAHFDVFPDSDSRRLNVSGPPIHNEVLSKVLTRLGQKADQTSGPLATWLRVDVLNGLWQVTNAQDDPFGHRDRRLGGYFREILGDHPHVAGIVLSAGASFGSFWADDEEIDLDSGAIGVRRRLCGMRMREALIVPLRDTEEAARGAEAWRKLYAAEPSWTDWALSKFHLPLTTEIFPPSQVG